MKHLAEPVVNSLYSYIFKYRKKGSLFWKKIEVDGHKFEKAQNKMVIFFKDGGLQEIADWKDHELKLGIDWVRAQKESMDEEAKTSV